MDYEIIISLLSLIALEVVIGIDNVVFISILANRLPKDQQKKATNVGLLLAAFLRLGLLLFISYIIKLDTEIFSIFNKGFSGKSLILIAGGLFLLYKSTKEIYQKVEGDEDYQVRDSIKTTFSQVIIQILIMDMVFSIDSVITAVGMVKEIWVMYVSVIITVIIMLVAAHPISNFVDKHPAFKILALSFLLLIGFSLVSEGFGVEIPKGYIYFSMAFSLLVDVVQMRTSKVKKKINPQEFVDEEESARR